jgi:hypothetical protein
MQFLYESQLAIHRFGWLSLFYLYNPGALLKHTNIVLRGDEKSTRLLYLWFRLHRRVRRYRAVIGSAHRNAVTVYSKFPTDTQLTAAISQPDLAAWPANKVDSVGLTGRPQPPSFSLRTEHWSIAFQSPTKASSHSAPSSVVSFTS